MSMSRSIAPDRRELSLSLKDNSRGPRIQKVLAEAAVASRRKCEDIIRAGRVTVNGQSVDDLPLFIDPQRDRIEVDGRRVELHAARPRSRRDREHVYVILNKPRRVISTTRDTHGRTAVLDLLPPAMRAKRRLYPVGRLDAHSTGLMLLTDDGELAHRLTHPRYGVPKQYLVTVAAHLDETAIENLQKGEILAHRTGRRRQILKRASLPVIRLVSHARDRTGGQRTRLAVILREGQNREIRRILARHGHKTRRIQRVAIGPIKIRGLGSGQWRKLTRTEVNRLYAVAGIK